MLLNDFLLNHIKRMYWKQIEKIILYGMVESTFEPYCTILRTSMPSSILQKFRNVGRLTHIVNILARYGFKRLNPTY